MDLLKKANLRPVRYLIGKSKWGWIGNEPKVPVAEGKRLKHKQSNTMAMHHRDPMLPVWVTGFIHSIIGYMLLQINRKKNGTWVRLKNFQRYRLFLHASHFLKNCFESIS